MDAHLTKTAQRCLAGAEGGTMQFPEIVGTLMNEGFESYAIDFRRATATYYLPNGDSIGLQTQHVGTPVAAAWNVATIQSAIREAQQLAQGYTYASFCAKIMGAGCAGYIVSFPGQRAVYFGRTAETHTEHFPQ